MFWRKKGSNENLLVQHTANLEAELAYYKTRFNHLEEVHKTVLQQLQLSEENINKKAIEVQQIITNYKDKLQAFEELSKQRLDEVNQLQKTLTVVKQKEDEKFNKMEIRLTKKLELKNRELEEKTVELEEKNVELAVKSREIGVLKLKGIEDVTPVQKEYHEVVVRNLFEEITELKKRLRQFVGEKQTHTKLDHYEYALIDYKDINIPLRAKGIRGYNRYAIEKLLTQEVKNKKDCKLWEKIQKDFGYRCAVTGNKYYEMDHFIPLNTGHGGAYEGNIIPLSSYYNSGKGNKNPFSWFKMHGNSISLKRWDDLIGYLAEKHDLSVEDYFEFVNWCFANPRTLEKLQKVNTPSLELWKHSKSIIIL